MLDWLKKALKNGRIENLGQRGEALAQAEYRAQGFSIVATNFFNRKGLRLGEIDFIAKSSSALVFVEVKTRTGFSGKFGSGVDAVDIYKQRKLLKAVKIFLHKRPELRELRPRIDVCLVEIDPLDNSRYSVIILPNAVEDEPR